MEPQPLNGQCWPLGGPQQTRAQRSGPSHPQPSRAPGHTPPTRSDTLGDPEAGGRGSRGAVFTVPRGGTWSSGGGFHITPWAPRDQGAPEQSGNCSPSSSPSPRGAWPLRALPTPLLPSPRAGAAIFLAVIVVKRASRGCRDKVPQTRQLKTAEVYSLRAACSFLLCFSGNCVERGPQRLHIHKRVWTCFLSWPL